MHRRVQKQKCSPKKVKTNHVQTENVLQQSEKKIFQRNIVESQKKCIDGEAQPKKKLKNAWQKSKSNCTRRKNKAFYDFSTLLKDDTNM